MVIPMPKTVTVYRYISASPIQRVIIGQARLLPDGQAWVDGFTPELLRHYRTEGILDYSTEEVVPIAQGEKFLAALYRDNQRTYVRAEETDD